jgi:DNA-binding Lrp family transcriptional regulator
LKTKRLKTNESHNSNWNSREVVLRSLDSKIIEDLLNDAFISSTDISKKHKAPLSTVQRRRRYLENTILTRRYEIDLRKQGFRIGEMTVYPRNASAKKIIDKIFSRYPSRILSISIKIDGSIVLTVMVYFKTTAEMHDMMADINSMPEVENTKFAETVDIIRDSKSKIANIISQGKPHDL